MTLHPKDNAYRLNKVVNDAMDAFWNAVRVSYPEIKTGDLHPVDVLEMERAATTVILKWLRSNAPKDTSHG